MNIIQKILENLKYLKGLSKRAKRIGILKTYYQVKKYRNKYLKLMYDNGYKVDHKYKIMLIANYSKIVYLLPHLDFETIINIVPTPFAKVYLAQKTNPFDEKYKLVDKVLFYKILKKNNIPIPKTYFYTKNGEFYDLNDKRVSDFKKYENIEMFVKASDGSGGKSADIINFNSQYKYNDNLIFQELVKSHDDIRKLAPVRAVQTLRINTYLTKKNEIEYDSYFIKLPPEGAVSDNSFTGSIMVSINPETGKLKKYGLTIFGNTLNNSYIVNHYDSSVKFENYKIPYWAEVKKNIEKMHSIFPNLRSIGWDIAVTNDGPVILEGNSVGNIFFEQLVSGPFFNKKMIQENIVIK